MKTILTTFCTICLNLMNCFLLMSYCLLGGLRTGWVDQQSLGDLWVSKFGKRYSEIFPPNINLYNKLILDVDLEEGIFQTILKSILSVMFHLRMETVFFQTYTLDAVWWFLTTLKLDQTPWILCLNSSPKSRLIKRTKDGKISAASSLVWNQI